MAAKANPSEESYAKACEIVSGWVASLSETTRTAIGEDDGGQLIDTLSWALDQTDERSEDATKSADLDALVAAFRGLIRREYADGPCFDRHESCHPVQSSPATFPLHSESCARARAALGALDRTGATGASPRTAQADALNTLADEMEAEAGRCIEWNEPATANMLAGYTARLRTLLTEARPSADATPDDDGEAPALLAHLEGRPPRAEAVAAAKEGVEALVALFDRDDGAGLGFGALRQLVRHYRRLSGASRETLVEPLTLEHAMASEAAPRQADALADWGDFLRIRHELIHRWIDEGKNAGEIVSVLAVDAPQVVFIAMSPLGPRAADPRWTAAEARPSADATTRPNMTVAYEGADPALLGDPYAAPDARRERAGERETLLALVADFELAERTATNPVAQMVWHEAAFRLRATTPPPPQEAP